jgi:hypothetical protein
MTSKDRLYTETKYWTKLTTPETEGELRCSCSTSDPRRVVVKQTIRTSSDLEILSAVFLWLLYYLSFFELLLLIPPLSSSNFSCKIYFHLHLYIVRKQVYKIKLNNEFNISCSIYLRNWNRYKQATTYMSKWEIFQSSDLEIFSKVTSFSIILK